MMRSASVMAALALLCACQSFSDASQKRPYSCNWRDAGADECPKNWRCGYDNRCFDPATPAGLKTCKFEQDCFDGYRCNAENACFNPALEEPRACKVKADCAPDWRCGLAAVCQDSKAGAAYPCNADLDCEQGWRCDLFAKVCAKVTDTLFGEARPVLSEKIHPLISAEVPLEVAANIPSSSVDRGVRVVVEVFDAGVRMLSYSRDTPPAVMTNFALPMPRSELSQVLAAGNTGLLRRSDGTVFGLTRDGGVTLIASNVSRLRQIDPRVGSNSFDFNDPALLAVSNNTVLMMSASLNQLPFTAIEDAGVIIDVAGSGDDVFTLRDWGVVYENSQRFIGCSARMFPVVARRKAADGGVIGCDMSAPINPGQSVVRLDAGVSFSVLATRHPLIGVMGFAVISRFDDGHVLGASGIGNVGNTNFRTNAPTVLCPLGLPPEQVSVTVERSLPGELQVAILSRCPEAVIDGRLVPAATWYIKSQNEGDNAVPQFSLYENGKVVWQQGGRAQLSTSARRVHAGRDFSMWADEYAIDGTKVTAPMMLDRVPGALLRLELQGKPSIVALTDSYVYDTGSSLGLLVQGGTTAGSNADFVPAGPVAGQPNWQVTRTGVIDLANFPLGSEQPRFVARIKTADGWLNAPANGQVQTLPNGDRLLVIVSGDRLLTADVTAAEQNPYLPPETLDVRLVPSPGVRLRGIAIDGTARQAGDGGSNNALTGFLLTDAALFSFVATSPTRWSLADVALPGEFGSPLQLWSEEGRARLGFDQGTVLTLPERVPLSSKLPRVSDAGVVSDFARLCRTTYAIRGDGLYRALAADGGASWQSISLDGVPAEERPGSKFFATENSVFVATPTGRVVELSLARSPADLPMCP